MEERLLNGLGGFTSSCYFSDNFCQFTKENDVEVA